MSLSSSEPKTCGIAISEIISDGGLHCLNCSEWRIAKPNGDVEQCSDCKDEGWNLFEDADSDVP
jgi:DNA-directed RNA polymerase subunit RPC12/RpoP